VNDFLQMPNDRGAESQILACAFMDPASIPDLADVANVAHFYTQTYAVIWDAMQAVFRSTKGLDPQLLLSWLQEHKLLGQAGGLETINETLNLRGTSHNVFRYAERVRDLARRRAIIAAAQDIAHKGMVNTIEDVESWAVGCETQLSTASEQYARSDSTTSAEAWDRFERSVMHPETVTTAPPIPSYSPTLNEMSVGGIPRKMSIIMGRPGMGKTAWAMSLIAPWLDQGRAGGFFSMEMREDEVVGRFAATKAQVPYRTLVDPKKSLDDDQVGRFMAAGQTVRDWRLLYDFEPGITATQIVARARRMKRRLGQLDFVVVDHFHKINHGRDHRGRDDSLMKSSSNALMDLANTLDCAVLLLAQLSRKCEERPDRKPIVSDLRECGALEEDAQLVLSPFWPWYYKRSTSCYRTASRNEAELLVLKNRDGAQGVVDLVFEPDIVAYRERH
jgi:replicative DNA helicase